MPHNNNVLWDLLQREEDFNKPGNKKITALDDLIAANPLVSNEFEQAVLKHRVNWGMTPEQWGDAPNPGADSFAFVKGIAGGLIGRLQQLRGGGAEQNEDQSIKHDDTYSYKEIHEEAVALRLQIGLKQVVDPLVLIGILGHQNAADCKTYLEQRIRKGEIPGIKPSSNIATLVNEYVMHKLEEYVRNERLEPWIRGKINAVSPDVLYELVQLKADNSEKMLAEHFGLSPAIIKELKDTAGRIASIAGQARTKLNDVVTTAYTEAAKAMSVKDVAKLLHAIRDGDTANLPKLFNNDELKRYVDFPKAQNVIKELLKAKVIAVCDSYALDDKSVTDDDIAALLNNSDLASALKVLPELEGHMESVKKVLSNNTLVAYEKLLQAVNDSEVLFRPKAVDSRDELSEFLDELDEVLDHQRRLSFTDYNLLWDQFASRYFSIRLSRLKTDDLLPLAAITPDKIKDAFSARFPEHAKRIEALSEQMLVECVGNAVTQHNQLRTVAAAYQDHINTLQDINPDVLKSLDAFKEFLPETLNEGQIKKERLADEDIESFRAQLGHRYLLSELNKRESADVLSIVSLGTLPLKEGVAKLQTRLSTLLPDFSNLIQAVCSVSGFSATGFTNNLAKLYALKLYEEYFRKPDVETGNLERWLAMDSSELSKKLPNVFEGGIVSRAYVVMGDGGDKQLKELIKEELAIRIKNAYKERITNDPISEWENFDFDIKDIAQFRPAANAGFRASDLQELKEHFDMELNNFFERSLPNFSIDMRTKSIGQLIQLRKPDEPIMREYPIGDDFIEFDLRQFPIAPKAEQIIKEELNTKVRAVCMTHVSDMKADEIDLLLNSDPAEFRAILARRPGLVDALEGHGELLDDITLKNALEQGLRALSSKKRLSEASDAVYTKYAASINALNTARYSMNSYIDPIAILELSPKMLRSELDKSPLKPEGISIAGLSDANLVDLVNKVLKPALPKFALKKYEELVNDMDRKALLMYSKSPELPILRERIGNSSEFGARLNDLLLPGDVARMKQLIQDRLVVENAKARTAALEEYKQLIKKEPLTVFAAFRSDDVRANLPKVGLFIGSDLDEQDVVVLEDLLDQKFQAIALTECKKAIDTMPIELWDAYRADSSEIPQLPLYSDLRIDLNDYLPNDLAGMEGLIEARLAKASNASRQYQALIKKPNTDDEAARYVELIRAGDPKAFRMALGNSHLNALDDLKNDLRVDDFVRLQSRLGIALAKFVQIKYQAGIPGIDTNSLLIAQNGEEPDDLPNLEENTVVGKINWKDYADFEAVKPLIAAELKTRKEAAFTAYHALITANPLKYAQLASEPDATFLVTLAALGDPPKPASITVEAKDAIHALQLADISALREHTKALVAELERRSKAVYDKCIEKINAPDAGKFVSDYTSLINSATFRDQLERSPFKPEGLPVADLLDKDIDKLKEDLKTALSTFALKKYREVAAQTPLDQFILPDVAADLRVLPRLKDGKGALLNEHLPNDKQGLYSDIDVRVRAAGQAFGAYQNHIRTIVMTDELALECVKLRLLKANPEQFRNALKAEGSLLKLAGIDTNDLLARDIEQLGSDLGNVEKAFFQENRRKATLFAYKALIANEPLKVLGALNLAGDFRVNLPEIESIVAANLQDEDLDELKEELKNKLQAIALEECKKAITTRPIEVISAIQLVDRTFPPLPYGEPAIDLRAHLPNDLAELEPLIQARLDNAPRAYEAYRVLIKKPVTNDEIAIYLELQQAKNLTAFRKALDNPLFNLPNDLKNDLRVGDVSNLKVLLGEQLTLAANEAYEKYLGSDDVIQAMTAEQVAGILNKKDASGAYTDLPEIKGKEILKQYVTPAVAEEALTQLSAKLNARSEKVLAIYKELIKKPSTSAEALKYVELLKSGTDEAFRNTLGASNFMSGLSQRDIRGYEGHLGLTSLKNIKNDLRAADIIILREALRDSLKEFVHEKYQEKIPKMSRDQLSNAKIKLSMGLAADKLPDIYEVTAVVGTINWKTYADAAVIQPLIDAELKTRSENAFTACRRLIKKPTTSAEAVKYVELFQADTGLAFRNALNGPMFASLSQLNKNALLDNDINTLKSDLGIALEEFAHEEYKKQIAKMTSNALMHFSGKELPDFQVLTAVEGTINWKTYADPAVVKGFIKDELVRRRVNAFTAFDRLIKEPVTDAEAVEYVGLIRAKTRDEFYKALNGPTFKSLNEVKYNLLKGEISELQKHLRAALKGFVQEKYKQAIPGMSSNTLRVAKTGILKDGKAEHLPDMQENTAVVGVIHWGQYADVSAVEKLINTELTSRRSKVQRYISFINENNVLAHAALASSKDDADFRNKLIGMKNTPLSQLIEAINALEKDDITAIKKHVSTQLQLVANKAYDNHINTMKIEQLGKLLFKESAVPGVLRVKTPGELKDDLPSITGKEVLREHVDPEKVKEVLKAKITAAYKEFFKEPPLPAGMSGALIESLLLLNKADFIDELLRKKVLDSKGWKKEYLELIDEDTLLDTLEELLSKKTLAVYEAGINDLTDEKVAELVNEFKQEDLDYFYDNTLPEYFGQGPDLVYAKNLSEEHVKQLRAQLVHRDILSRLQQHVSTIGEPRLLGLCTSDPGAFKTGLKVLCNDPDYNIFIDEMVITPQMMSGYHKIIAPRVIQTEEAIKQLTAALHTINDGPDLGELYKAPTLDAFKTSLKAAKVNGKPVFASHLEPMIEHINETQMQALQQEARNRRFEMQVDRYSIFGADAHPSLRGIFSKLPVGSQTQLLDAVVAAKRTGEPGPLSHILNTKDPSVLKQYLKGISKEGVGKLQAENKRNNGLRGFHNAAVTKIFAKLAVDQGFTIDVATINRFLLAAKDKQLLDSAGSKGYIDLVNAILTRGAPAAFFKAFGLNAAGTALDGQEGENIARAVSEQHGFNKALFDEYAKENSGVNKHLIDVILRTEKVVAYQNVKGMDSHFKKSEASHKSVLAAYGAVCKPAMDKETLAEAVLNFAREFTPEEFRKIKDKTLADVFTTSASAQIDAELRKIPSILEEQANRSKMFAEHQNKMDFVLKFKDLHIHSLLFQSKATEMRGKFEAYAKQSEVAIDQLRTDRAVLVAYINNLGEFIKRKDADKGSKAQAEKLLVKLEKAKEQLDKQLIFYVDVRDRINDKLLKAIDDSKAKTFYYEPQDFATHNVKRSDLGTAPLKDKDAAVAGFRVGTSNATSERVEGFVYGAKANSDQVRCFDMKYPVARGNPTSAVIEGRFVLDDKKQTVEFLKFPSGPPNDESLVKARIAYSMAAAVTALTKLAEEGRKPSKDDRIPILGSNPEEVRYAWTAMVVLGQKMGFGPEALDVYGGNDVFDPEQEKGRFFGYKKESLVEVFKTHHETVDKAISNVKQKDEQQKKVEKEVNPAEKHLEKANMHSMKEAFKQVRETGEARKKAEGVKPELTEVEKSELRTRGK